MYPHPSGSQMEFGLRQPCFIASILTAPTSRNQRFRPAFCPKACREAKTQVRFLPTSILIASPTDPGRGRSPTPPKCKEDHTEFSMKRDLVSEGYIVRVTTSIQTACSQESLLRQFPRRQRFQSGIGNCSNGMKSGPSQAMPLLPSITSRTIPCCGFAGLGATFGPTSMRTNMLKTCVGKNNEQDLL